MDKEEGVIAAGLEQSFYENQHDNVATQWSRMVLIGFSEPCGVLLLYSALHCRTLPYAALL